MEFDFSDQQKAMVNTVREFAVKEIIPSAEELDRTAQFPYDLFKKCGELGLTAVLFPEEFGGLGLDTMTYVLVVQELARGDMSLAVTYFVSVVNGMFLVENAARKFQEKYVPGIASGEAIGAFGLTEPDAGSDSRSMRTRAILDGDEYIINGTKNFITNAGTEITTFANIICIVDQDESGNNLHGIVLVPRDNPGYRVNQGYKKMGWRSSDTREIYLEDCRVPADHLLVGHATGLKAAFESLCLGRMGLAASSLGLAMAAYDASMEYAKTRIQFGQPISRFQRVQDMLVDMEVRIQAARLLLYKAAYLRDSGKDFRKAASIAKYYCSETGKICADYGVQIHGGYGYLDEYAVSRYYRDIRIATIGDGTSQIQKMIIAKFIGC